ncbi:MAG: OmpA family protein [Puniceicoccales bacterium]|nr:OmpA family protein [Puniceicoccales bacterium]
MKKRTVQILCMGWVCFSLVACRSARSPLKPEDTKIAHLGSPSDSTENGYFSPLPGRMGSLLSGPSEGKIGGIYSAEEVHSRVYFEFDNASLNEEARGALRAVAEKLLREPASRLLIAGHCDWYGTEDYNLRLGENRAQSAERFLKGLGISSSRMETVSMGSTYATSGLEKDEAKKDRRADLVFVSSSNAR